MRHQRLFKTFSKPAVAGIAALLLVSSNPLLAQLSDGSRVGSEAYAWHNVRMGGGGFVTGILFHPREPGLMYARTDVGGAYRWDVSSHAWIPLTDWLGQADRGFTGIESLALDPSDSKRVYLAAGIYSGVRAAILRSDDQGHTWQRTDVPFKMGGNETGRFNGERLAVNPNDGAILFFGSRQDGLWKSVDRAVTWKRVESFPSTDLPPAASQSSNSTDGRRRFNRFSQQAGIVFVQFVPASGRPGSPTPVIYAGVSVVQTNLFRSTDGGLTWQAVPGQPIGLRPNHLALASDGVMYLSYGLEPGPNTMSDGALWKYNPADSVWTDITPVRPKESGQPFGYGCVAVDPQHSSVVMATTFAHWRPHDQIFRSTNGGASWMQLWETNKSVWDHSSAPYTRTRTPHWMGTVAINPFSADQVLVTTGYGIWCCTNATGAETGLPTHWVFLNQGLEETVPLALISPPAGPQLISGVGDIDGFCHEDVNVSPAGGSFSGPQFSSTRDLVFAASRPGIIARIGNAGRNVSVHAAISDDGGKSWKALGSDPLGGSSGQGRLALSADGRALVWALRGSAAVTTDRGMTWTNCQGISSVVGIVADPVNAAWFYALDGQTGRLLVSTNLALSFEPAAAVSGWRSYGGGFLAATPGLQGDLWVGSRTLGLYHSTNGGMAFVRVNRVGGADAFGFGKAAPGKDFPALYLAGDIRQLHAFYRSDDAGQSWVRINDDQHQYGTADRPLIVGDPRLYGRVYLTTGGRGVIYGEPVASRP